MRYATRTLSIGVTALLIVGGGVAATRATSAAGTQASCNVQGVWKMTKGTVNGQPVTTITEVKVVTKDHFMWVQQENGRDTLPLRTFRDTTRKFSDAGGYGTYRLSGNNYVERIELFPDPSFIGKEWPATCQTTKDQWTHTYISPDRTDSTGRMRRDTVVEYLTRVE